MRACVASIPGFPVALPVWYRLPRAEREGTHHVQRARELELRSSELRQYDVLHSLLSHARHVIFQDRVPAILVF
jgi:hypothetical protein